MVRRLLLHSSLGVAVCGLALGIGTQRQEDDGGGGEESEQEPEDSEVIATRARWETKKRVFSSVFETEPCGLLPSADDENTKNDSQNEDDDDDADDVTSQRWREFLPTAGEESAFNKAVANVRTLEMEQDENQTSENPGIYQKYSREVTEAVGQAYWWACVERYYELDSEQEDNGEEQGDDDQTGGEEQADENAEKQLEKLMERYHNDEDNKFHIVKYCLEQCLSEEYGKIADGLREVGRDLVEVQGTYKVMIGVFDLLVVNLEKQEKFKKKQDVLDALDQKASEWVAEIEKRYRTDNHSQLSLLEGIENEYLEHAREVTLRHQGNPEPVHKVIKDVAGTTIDYRPPKQNDEDQANLLQLRMAVKPREPHAKRRNLIFAEALWQNHRLLCPPESLRLLENFHKDQSIFLEMENQAHGQETPAFQASHASQRQRHGEADHSPRETGSAPDSSASLVPQKSSVPLRWLIKEPSPTDHHRTQAILLEPGKETKISDLPALDQNFQFSSETCAVWEYEDLLFLLLARFEHAKAFEEAMWGGDDALKKEMENQHN